MEIPRHIERAVRDAVARQLERELGSRGLLLPADRLEGLEHEAGLLGAGLLSRVVDLCYQTGAQPAAPVEIEFSDERDAVRVNAALAFGAVTAALLAPGSEDSRQTARSVELLCAMFNLGIGLVDGLCDEDPDVGGLLLGLIEGRDLIQAAARTPTRGWLASQLPPRLLANPAVAFTVEVIEAFFRSLHAVYPGAPGSRLRHRVGTQLADALEAERQSVGLAPQASRHELIECSRKTSVLPFQIIEALALGGARLTEPGAGTLLGEAAWRIDDLVDLCQDARRGALNGLLLAGAEESSAEQGDPLLERLLRSDQIAAAAAAAAERLLSGLQLACDHGATAQAQGAFLHFIQRYAGVVPGRVRD